MKTKELSVAFFVLVFFMTLGLSVRGQTFQLMRYDENYGYLKDSTLNFYDHLKFIPLSAKKDIYMSFGGEAREEFDAFDNEDWGRFNAGKDNFFLQRYDLHAYVHFGDRIRFFVQLRSALENGRPNGPRPIDEDQLNVQNLFVDVKILRSSKDSLICRGGRQELNCGSGRLISVREGPNVRLYFTGLKLMYVYKNLSLDAFAMESSQLTPGVFDDKMSGQVNLWGIYSTIKLTASQRMDFYYIGDWMDSIVYEEGKGNEVRHTLGARWYKNNDGFIYDLESAYQFGKFNSGSINAWTASIDLGYIFGELKSKPAFGIKNDYISGDSKPGDGNLQTFNPIYPKGGYFGFDPQIGPVNLIDIHPYGSLFIFPRLSFLWDVVFNWRYSLGDGIYRPSGAFNLTGAGSDKRYIGTDYLAKLSYVFSKFFSADFGVQYFRTGPYINSEIANHKNALETNTRISFKF